MGSLTILSVYHSELSKRLLELNGELTALLNPGVTWKWIALDNSPAELAIEPLDPQKFTTIRGVTMKEILASLPEFLHDIKASYHHATAINRGLAHVSTRFVLVLDNDFYILMPNWIADVTTYMQEHNLAFFGSTWHPRWWKKVRYFPAQFSMFIDTQKVDVQTLDFTPGYDTKHSPERVAIKSARRLPWIARVPLVAPLVNEVVRRSRIGASRDTSYRVYERYFRSGLGFEAVQAVFKPRETSRPFIQLLKTLGSRITPDRFQYTPKDVSVYTTVSFGERGYPDVLGATGWEEYVWREVPFAFHLRGTSLWRETPDEQKLETVRSLLSGFLPR